MRDTAVEVKDLRKTYGDVVAVDHVSFDVKQGEIFGLLGPNGGVIDRLVVALASAGLAAALVFAGRMHQMRRQRISMRRGVL